MLKAVYPKGLIFILILLVSGSIYSGQHDPEIESKVDLLFSPLVQDNLISGSVLISRQGNVVLAKGYGPANREWNIANTPDTKFRIGSVTKQFTAMAIIILCRQGKLNPDDTLDQFLPGYPNAGSITLHQLLNHTSGVQSYNRVKDYPEMLIREMSIDQVIKWFENEPVVGKPGEKFAYSNSGYVLLAAVIEKVSGMDYASFLKKYIFDPLAMRSSGQDVFEHILPSRATGHSVYEGVLYQAPYRNMPFTSGAGSLYSTVLDLHKWTKAILKDKIVSGGLKDLMFTPGKANYGYGWFIRQVFGRQLIEHAGAINGFGAQVQIFPAEKVVVIALYNFESTFQRKMDQALAAVALGEKYAPVYFDQGKNINIDTFKKAYGKFSFDQGKTSFNVINKDNVLSVDFSNGKSYKCLPQSEMSFFIKELNFLLTMRPEKNGDLNKLLISAGLHRFMAQRMVKDKTGNN